MGFSINGEREGDRSGIPMGIKWISVQGIKLGSMVTLVVMLEYRVFK